ncbi:DUF3800 domain-containing protein [Sphingomonas sp. BGYR3]|uniref:DUF3800 domain-containing protein n=1 Tax=Sphingomonas sp. BGYR3 TaxID=2975483 RepID=UPI0021A60E6D|nr:DUF3800 domain-containing protein [Sphingomonas sp. BGYR3]MDG5488472.1 DUF3800 domain-containing protein [Sphingomonas sp. BGYR3]
MSVPPSNFTAFIDESGCSGNRFGEGSSQFLAMTAVIVRDDWLGQATSIFRECRDAASSDRRYQKFSRESDKNRFLLSQQLGRAKVATVFVAAHKPSMGGTYIRDNHSNEYNYLLKMLVERVSWAVRDAKTLPDRANGPCKLVLSEQRMYPYPEMFDYFRRLRRCAHNCSAEWSAISNDDPIVTKHEDETPVHLADIAASSFAMAIEPKMFGMTDDRFLRNLSATIYTRYGKRFGLKLFPDESMRETAQRLNKLL